MCHRFDTQNMKQIMAPLLAFNFFTVTKVPFASTGLDFFDQFYIEDKIKIEKLWTYFYMPLYASSPFGNMCRLEYRHFPHCIPTVRLPKLSTYFAVQQYWKNVCWASEELKKLFKALNKDRIYEALAAVNATWKFNPPYGALFGGVWE